MSSFMTSNEVPSESFERYRRLQRYVGWTDDDAARVGRAARFVEPAFRDLIDDFYAAIEREPQAAKVITGGAEQIERLKGTLRRWLAELFSGRYDEQYVARRWQVGWRHVEIGLDQVFTNVALSRLKRGLVRVLEERWSGDQMELKATIVALNQLIDLDLAIIEDAYQTEFLRRQQRSERLSSIGQVAGGIAHELRNPLNVVKTSVYYLINARNPSPEKMATHLQRIERQVGVADGVITALNDFAKLPLPEFKPVPLETCLREALENANLPESIRVSLDIPPGTPAALGDHRQLGIVFGNLIRNARDAMTNGGELRITAVSRETVEVEVADTGVGISPEHLARVTDPLFTTKARGIGLGLAISRAILDKHLGSIDVTSRLGEGTKFTVRLPPAPIAEEVP
jgi:signal transduction histidine kinase